MCVCACACVRTHTHILRHIRMKTTDLECVEGVAEKCDPETIVHVTEKSEASARA